MALPTFVAAGAIASGVGAITPALPAGIQTDDILLLIVETRSGSSNLTIPTPNGGTWTGIAGPNPGGTSGSTLSMYWSRYNGTQGAPTTNDTGNHQGGAIFGFTGVTTSDPPYEAEAHSSDATSDTTVTALGGTTTGDDRLVVVSAARSDDAIGAYFSAWTNSDLANITEIFDDGWTDGDGGGFGVITGEKAAAGTFGSTTATVAVATQDAWISLALIPAGGGASVTGVGAIASAEAFGTARLVRVLAELGLASAETFGTARPTRVTGPQGVASAETLGAPRLLRLLAAQGVTSAEAFGIVNALRLIGPVGLASGESFGTAQIIPPGAISAVGGIVSAEAFGVASLIRVLSAHGVLTGETFGEPRVARVLLPGGITSGQALGVPAARFQLAPAGLASLEQVGAGNVRRVLAAAGLDTAEALGTVDVRRVVGVAGLATLEAFGQATLTVSGAAVDQGSVRGDPALSDTAVYDAAISEGSLYAVLVSDRVLGIVQVSDSPGE